jgi:hypothetical protein
MVGTFDFQEEVSGNEDDRKKMKRGFGYEVTPSCAYCLKVVLPKYEVSGLAALSRYLMAMFRALLISHFFARWRIELHSGWRHEILRRSKGISINENKL